MWGLQAASSQYSHCVSSSAVFLQSNSTGLHSRQWQLHMALNKQQIACQSFSAYFKSVVAISCGIHLADISSFPFGSRGITVDCQKMLHCVRMSYTCAGCQEWQSCFCDSKPRLNSWCHALWGVALAEQNLWLRRQCETRSYSSTAVACQCFQSQPGQYHAW